MAVIVLFAAKPDFWVTLALVVALAVLMFIPMKFVHPVRTERWRPVTLPVTLVWTIFAGWAAWSNFDPQSWAIWGLVLTSIYLMLAGGLQQVIPLKK